IYGRQRHRRSCGELLRRGPHGGHHVARRGRAADDRQQTTHADTGAHPRLRPHGTSLRHRRCRRGARHAGSARTAPVRPRRRPRPSLRTGGPQARIRRRVRRVGGPTVGGRKRGARHPEVPPGQPGRRRTGSGGASPLSTSPSMAAPLRPLMILRLLAGRGVFRVGVQLMAVALLAIWGTATYGEYANAWGTCAWLVFLPTAAEKAALKILPRTRLTTVVLAGLTLRIAATPVVVLAVALAFAVVVAPSSTATLYLASGTWSACTGLLMTLSGLHRLRGRPALDAAAFTVVAVAVAVVTTMTWLSGWSPHTHLRMLVGAIAVVIGCSLSALPNEWLRAPKPDRPRLTRAFGRSTVLLGITELLDALTLSALFLVFALSGRMVDSGPFHLALLAAGVLCSLSLY